MAVGALYFSRGVVLLALRLFYGVSAQIRPGLEGAYGSDAGPCGERGGKKRNEHEGKPMSEHAKGVEGDGGRRKATAQA